MVVQDVVALRAQESIGISRRLEIRVGFVVETVIDHGVWQLLSVEDLLVTVSDDGGLRG